MSFKCNHNCNRCPLATEVQQIKDVGKYGSVILLDIICSIGLTPNADVPDLKINLETLEVQKEEACL